MCYRPAGMATIVKCLECGGFNKPTDDTCQKCGADLTESKKAANVGAGAPAAKRPEISLTPQGLDRKPAAPGAPQAPQAPGGPPKPPTG